MNMKEFECRQHLRNLESALHNTQSWPPNYQCECSKKAKRAQGKLIRRICDGDDQALDQLMSYYPCFNGWLKEAFDDAEWRCIGMAMVKNTMMHQTQGNFIVELRLALIRRGIEIFTLQLQQYDPSGNQEMGATSMTGNLALKSSVESPRMRGINKWQAELALEN